nr:L,D-transpeptidase family protein [uncultured Sphingomonas sp.]
MRSFISVAAPFIFAAAAVAQQPGKTSLTAEQAQAQWKQPGTPGSPIDGTAFHAQVLLDAAGFSPGVIDGKNGMSLKNAIRGFQKSRGLAVNGVLDTPTRQALLANNRPSTIMVKLTPQQVAGPFVYPFPKKPEGQAKLPSMGYRNMLEKVAEDFHTTPDTIVALNGPAALIGPGQTLKLPNVVPARTSYQTNIKDEYSALMRSMNVAAGDIRGSHIIVDKSEGLLKVLDDKDKLVAQFPVTTGSGHDPLPLGNWKVTTYAFLPPFHYQPDLFWDVSDDKEAQKLPPGPNGPVGVAWLDLTKEHYGIHGTPEPSTIGRTQSHGCIRMTNWDVLRLSQMMKPGFKAEFVA